MSKNGAVRVSALRESELGEAVRIVRLAFGTFLGLPDLSRDSQVLWLQPFARHFRLAEFDAEPTNRGRRGDATHIVRSVMIEFEKSIGLRCVGLWTHR
jgi:hypothetical protein